MATTRLSWVDRVLHSRGGDESGSGIAPMENPLPAQANSYKEPEKKRWVEPVTALLMALATLGTAWCSYESAAWTRRANRLLNEFSALERRASLLSIQGMQAATIHTAMFMELLAAQQAGNEKLAQFYAQRFPPDARKATRPGSHRSRSKIPRPIPIPSSRDSTKSGEPARPLPPRPAPRKS